MGVERREKIKEEVREKEEKYKFECETGRQKEKKTFKKNVEKGKKMKHGIKILTTTHATHQKTFKKRDPDLQVKITDIQTHLSRYNNGINLTLLHHFILELSHSQT